MSQVIQLSVKPQRVTCRLKDNLKEKFYNFSLKMNLKEQEFLSYHSPKFQNNIVAAAIPEKTEELKDSCIKEIAKDNNENYQNMMDENKILQTNHLISNVNRNFEKMRNDHSCSRTDTVETNKTEDDLQIPPVLKSRPSIAKVIDDDLPPILPTLQHRVSSIPKTPRKDMGTSVIARNKDIAWDFCEITDCTMYLEVRFSYVKK